MEMHLQHIEFYPISFITTLCEFAGSKKWNVTLFNNSLMCPAPKLMTQTTTLLNIDLK
jgi:hypothetical protein